MADSLPRPGVQVIQQFRTTSPTVITPTLVPCVVGVCKQVVELFETDATGGQIFNGDALINLPAFFIAKAATGSPVKYTGLDGLKLALSVNNGVVVEVTFSDAAGSGLTPATVVSQINARFTAVGLTSALAEAVGTTQFQVRTVGTGDFQSILIGSTTDSAVATAFGVGVGKTYTGFSSYSQYSLDIPPQAMPDPRGNLDELTIESDSIRVFLATGNSTDVQEAKTDESFLNNGRVNVSATVVTSTDISGLTYPGDVTGLTLVLSVDGGSSQTVTIGTPASATAFVAEVDAALSGATATDDSNTLRITSGTGGYSSSIAITDGTLLSGNGGPLTFVALTDNGESIEAVDDGNGDAVTSIIDFNGEDFTVAGAVATLTGSAAATAVTDGNTIILSDGGPPQTITFSSALLIANIVDQINAVTAPAAGGKITASDSGGALLLTHNDKGKQSMIEVVGGTALAEIDPGGTPTIVAGAKVYGTAYPPAVGDYLYVDGVFYGIITQVAPGGAADRLKIDRYVGISSDVGQYWYIIAKNLTDAASTTRPIPDLVVDLNGNVSVKHNLLRDTTGAPISSAVTLYVSYTALRGDVTALADNPGLLRFDDTTTLETALEPITVDNPLGLGLYFALLNAPGVQVTGLGVDAISADMPFGTLEAWTRAVEYLEAFEVYGLAPLTHDLTVAQVFLTHVTTMSEPENRGERVVMFNPETPATALDALVASGTQGDGINTTTFDTKVANLAALVQNAGITPTGTIAVTEGLYLDIATDDKKYSIKSISGSRVTVRTTAGEFASGENDDDYYSEATLPTPLVGEVFSIKVRGAALETVAGTPDNDAIAETMNELGASYGHRRFWMTFPDQCGATISGVEQFINGFYMNAASVGMMAQQPPQQSFTNFPVTGFTRPVGSNDTFGERQLDVMAGGGIYIYIQESTGGPIFSRMALTTDLTSIETRTDSVTKVVDFTAKFMRRSLRNFIGKFNITQGFLDSLGTTVQGLGGFLVETGVLIGMTLDNIIQDEDNRDTVLIDSTLDVPIPCNYLKLTLLV